MDNVSRRSATPSAREKSSTSYIVFLVTYVFVAAVLALTAVGSA